MTAKNNGNRPKERVLDSSVLYGKIPPQNKEAEKAVLSQLLMGSNRLDELKEILPDADRFYVDNHQRIYNAILKVSDRGGKVDAITVCEYLSSVDELEMVGGPHGVVSLTMDFGFMRGIGDAFLDHAMIISDCFKRRKAIELGGEMVTKSYETRDSIDEIVHSAEKGLLEILSEGDVSKSKTFRDLVIPFNEHLHAAKANKREVTGIDTGYDRLNEMTSGWQDTDLIILAARPSGGKTAFALNLAMNGVNSDGKPIAIFSLEMNDLTLFQRVVSAVTAIDLERIRNGKVSDIELAHINQTMDRIIQMPIHIEEEFVVNINQLRARAKRLKRNQGVGMIIVDYLQLMAGDKSGGNREQEISKISRGLKGIAKELKIPVIALSQMSRGIETRTDKEPQLADLRESGAIEQDADVVIFIYHELEPNSGDPVNCLKIAKNRNGKVGYVKELRFFPNIQRWMNPDDAKAYAGQTEYKPFSGIVPHADERIEGKKQIQLLGDDEDAPF